MSIYTCRIDRFHHLCEDTMKTSQAEPTSAEATYSPRGTKTAAIKTALSAHPTKGPKEIAELLQAEGWDVKPQNISVVKSNLKAETKKAGPALAAKRTFTPAPEKTVAPARQAAKAASGNDIPYATLRRAKDLSNQLGGVQEAKRTLDALAQLID
jgi:hypothetical protein